MTSSSYSNGVSESRTYNDDNTLAGISFTGASIGNLTYGWDENKNKTSESIAGTMSGYGFSVGSSGYDNKDRLVNWQRSDSNLNQACSLSLVGDWNSITENATTQNRTHGPTHELVSAWSPLPSGEVGPQGPGEGTVTHDAKGNMTLIPAVLRPSSSSLPATASRLTRDFENKLLAADTNNDSTDDVFYKFDALGRRVARTANSATTVYFQSGQQKIADYTAGTAASSPTYNYVYASYIDEPVMRSTGSAGARHYFHRNQQYSITAITDGSGGIAERYAYTAYGTPTITDASGASRTTTAVGNRYTYTGREWDESLALYHYRARMYDSVAGRFVSRDPIGMREDAINIYGIYGVTKSTDPTGHCECKPRTTSECCEAAREKWVSNGNVLGLTFCCDGVRTSCVWPDIIEEDYHDPIALPLTTKCVRVHEWEHKIRTICPDKTCGKLMGGQSVPDVSREKEHCFVYLAELKCLIAKYKKCNGSDACEAEMMSAIADTRKHAIENCIKGNVTPIPEFPRNPI